MNTQFPFVDANNSYVVARSPNEHNVSASPSFINHASNYVQGPMQNNFHASNSHDFSNIRHMYPNSHASATPQIHMPMSNMMSSINQFETPQVRISSAIQESVSPFYSSATNLQYVNPTSPMDGRIGHATTSYSASYSQPSYATPDVSNSSAPYTTVDTHNSASHLPGYSRMNVNFTGAVVPNIVEDEVVVAALKSLAQNKRISALCLEQHEKGLFPDYAAIKVRVLQEDESLPIDKIGEQKYVLTIMHVPSPSTTSYYTPPTQLQNFGNTRVSLPKESKSIGGKSYPEWDVIENKLKANFVARRQKET